MGSWSNVGQKSGGSDLPILKIGESPVRLRFIAGPGKFEGPEERWQHWPPDSDSNRSPVLCIGARSGCIFHQEPLKWVKASEGGGSLKKSYLANVVVYEMDKGTCTGRKVYVLGGNQIYDQIAQQCAMLGVEAPDYDWVIGKSGTGKQTKYTATMVPKALEPNGIDLSSLEDQNPEWAAAENPKLIDFDKFEGFKKRTPQEQAAWFEGRTQSNDETTEETPAAAATTATAPPAAPSTPPPGSQSAKPKINLPPLNAPAAAPAAAAPPPPAPVAVAPPPAPAGPSQADIDAAKAKINSWNAGSAENVEHLNYVLTTDGFDQAFKDAAKLLLSLGETTKAVAPPPAPAAAATGAVDEASLKQELQGALTSMTVFKSFPNMKKFFNKAGADKSALNALTAEDMQTLLKVVRQGEEAVKAFIQV